MLCVLEHIIENCFCDEEDKHEDKHEEISVAACDAWKDDGTDQDYKDGKASSSTPSTKNT